jgi:chemotaxis protein histidine kinase CheA
MNQSLRSIQATALTLFTEEFQTNLPQILAALDTVQSDRSNRAAAKEAHRLIHALKGGAAMVGLAAFGYLLNVAEEMIEESTVGSKSLTDGPDTPTAACRGLPRIDARLAASRSSKSPTAWRARYVWAAERPTSTRLDLIELEANERAAADGTLTATFPTRSSKPSRHGLRSSSQNRSQNRKSRRNPSRQNRSSTELEPAPRLTRLTTCSCRARHEEDVLKKCRLRLSRRRHWNSMSS